MENEMEQIRNSLTQPQHTADRGNGRKKWQHQREYLLNFQCNHQHLQLQFHRASPSSSRMDSTFCCCFFCVELCFCEAYTKRNVGMKQKKRRIKNRKKYTNKRSRNKSRLEKLTFGQSLPLTPHPFPSCHACMHELQQDFRLSANWAGIEANHRCCEYLIPFLFLFLHFALSASIAVRYCCCC